MSTTLSVKSQDSNGVTYADPAKPDTTIRFRFGSTTKVLSGVSVPNFATEIIVNDNNPVTISGVSAQDALSVRIRVSGSLESKVRLRQFLSSISAQLEQWADENVMQGFRPATAPVVVDVA